MIYEFYNIIGKKRSVQRIGLSNSFSIGFGKYLDNIIDLYEKDDKVMLTPIIRANLKKLKDGDNFIVGVRVKDDLYTLGVHVSASAQGQEAVKAQYTEKCQDIAFNLVTLYDEMCAEIKNKQKKEVWGTNDLRIHN
jgi:hypothetical protein